MSRFEIRHCSYYRTWLWHYYWWLPFWATTASILHFFQSFLPLNGTMGRGEQPVGNRHSLQLGELLCVTGRAARAQCGWSALATRLSQWPLTAVQVRSFSGLALQVWAWGRGTAPVSLELQLQLVAPDWALLTHIHCTFYFYLDFYLVQQKLLNVFH